MPPDRRRRHGAKQRRREAALEFAELVGGVDEQIVHGADAAAHRVGRGQLHERDADHHAHHVGRANDGQAPIDSQIERENANTTVAAPKMITA